MVKIGSFRLVRGICEHPKAERQAAELCDAGRKTSCAAHGHASVRCLPVRVWPRSAPVLAAHGRARLHCLRVYLGATPTCAPDA